jgi:glycosyltransferase involved in cell wall biosynthesis
VNIALDARKLFDGGIGTYIRNLLQALATRPEHRWTALVDPSDVGRVKWRENVQEVPVRAGKYSLAEHWVIPGAARRASAELLHAPHYTLPLLWNGPSVVTIHDLIHVRYPHFFPVGAAVYAKAMASMAARRARIVIVDSRHTSDDIQEFLAISKDKIRVIPLGVSESFGPRTTAEVEAFRRQYELPKDYLLYVGARRRHKNLELLLQALAAIPAGKRPPLVLSGEPWTAETALASLAATLSLQRDVYFAGDPENDDTLALLYSGATLYVQPSLSEGFGLPPLEAMACGVPVLSSTGGSLPEAVGDAAVLLEPRDPDRWADAILTLLGDASQRSDLATRGRQRAREFTWQRTAAETLEAYRTAAR